MQTIAETLDCSRHSSDRFSKQCDQQGDAGIAIVAILVVLMVALGSWFFRAKRRQVVGDAPTSGREAETALDRLREDYREGLESGDEGTHQAMRDWYAPLRVEAGATLYLVVLVGSLVVLIPLFALLKSLTS